MKSKKIITEENIIIAMHRSNVVYRDYKGHFILLTKVTATKKRILRVCPVCKRLEVFIKTNEPDLVKIKGSNYSVSPTEAGSNAEWDKRKKMLEKHLR